MLFLCFFCTFFYAQSNTSKAVSENQIQIEPSESTKLEETLPIQRPAVSSEEPVKQPSTFHIFFRMILVLIFVVACMYAVIRFMKNGLTRPESNDPFLRKVSSVSISPGKSIQVVTLLDHAYIVGVSDASINVIGQVDDKELVDAMNLYADKNTSSTKPRTFNDILALFMPNSAENKNVFKNSAKDVSDLLKRQRDRLNDSDNGGEL